MNVFIELRDAASGWLEARDIAKLGIGVSIAFAVLAIAALVALPIGLYMVTTPAIPAS